VLAGPSFLRHDSRRHISTAPHGRRGAIDLSGLARWRQLTNRERPHGPLRIDSFRPRGKPKPAPADLRAPHAERRPPRTSASSLSRHASGSQNLPCGTALPSEGSSLPPPGPWRPEIVLPVPDRFSSS
jgi:hypothetical protein